MSGIFDQIINYSPPLIVSGTVNYKGTWNASTNNPTLNNPPAASTKGDYYVVSTAGTQFSITFGVGDWIISNSTAWEKVDLTDAVSSVFGRTGAVVGVSTDYSAVGLTNTAIGATTPSTGAFTTLSATGDVTASGGNILNTSGGTIPIRVSGATTGSSVARFANTGGDTFFGAEGNATNNLIIGCTAYDTIVRGPSGIAFSANNGTNMQMRLSSTGLAVTGALSATTSALVNRSGVTAPTSIATNAAQFVGATGESTNLEIDTFAATPFIYGVRRQGTPASPTATQSGNNLLAISGRGYGTTTTSGDGARILFQAAENFTDSANGSRILLQATATGSTSVGTIATVDATGLAVTGALSSTGALAIGNTVNTVSPTSPNRTVTIVIGGTTYYLAAKTTND